MSKCSNGKFICAICYEEAKPNLEDLQSISLCGHVFHELCLQQWLEYCPRGRKCTCPLCKQPCSAKEVHRLYFQSASEVAQATQENCVAESYACADDVHTLQVMVQKLTGQLSVTKSSLESHQEQLQESNRQLSLCTLRAEKAESAQVEAKRERASLRDSLARIQEELKRSTTERCKLHEKNTALVKELAANNLAQSLGIDEEEVARMARVGCGNKEDVIDALTRSLVVRNRAYKDLMAKCNGLGTGESKALRKLEKALERIKLLKARVQELEKGLEEKENVDLRQMKMSSTHCTKVADSPVIANKSVHDRTKPPLPLQPSPQANLASLNEAGRILDEDHRQFSTNDEELGLIGGVKCVEAIERDAWDIVNSKAALSGHTALEVRISQGLKTMADKSEANTGVIEETYSDMDTFSFNCIPITIRKEVRLSASEITATSSKWDNQTVNISRWHKQPSPGNPQHGDSSSSGTFISVGANGRGGQAKVLRPPLMLKVSGASSDNNWLRPGKKAKSSRNIQQQHCNRQGSLQIEHFFGGL